MVWSHLECPVPGHALFEFSEGQLVVLIQVKSCPSLGASYKGLASSAKPGIHRQQKPAEPKNSFPCLAVVGVGILSAVSFHASETHCCPSFKMYLRYVTCCMNIWAFLAEAHYPSSPRVLSSCSVPVRQVSRSMAAISRSSTYCNKLISGFCARYSLRSSCKASSKMVGKLFYPHGSLVHVSWLLIPISESCHSKVKYC